MSFATNVTANSESQSEFTSETYTEDYETVNTGTYNYTNLKRSEYEAQRNKELNVMLENIHEKQEKWLKILSHTNIINVSEKNKQQISTELQNVSENSRENINKFVGHVYFKYDEWPRRKEHLLNTSKELSNDIENLQNQIRTVNQEDISHKIKIHAVDNLSNELEQNLAALKTITNLMVIHDLLIKVKDLQENRCYIKAGIELLKVEQCINVIPEDEITDVIITLKLKISTDKAELKQEIAHIFDQHVKMIEVKPRVVNTNVIKIKQPNNELKRVISVLVMFNHKAPIKELCKFIWKNMCRIIILNNTYVKVVEESGFRVFSVSKKQPTKSSYKEVLLKLSKLFKFLHTNFNYSVEDFKTLSFISKELEVNLCETLLKECLRDAVPKSDEMIAVTKEVVENIKKFYTELVTMEIFNPITNPILEYTNQLEVSLIGKKCHEYLGNAIAIMKKDLQIYVRIGTPSSSTKPLKIDEFPECSVSKSAVELIETTEKLLQQATLESQLSAQKLICTLQSIFYQYGNIVCGHHDRLLQTAPKQVALFRNNCMYIAHQLIKYNKNYAKKFSTVSLPDPLLFTDQAHQLRTMGGEVFLTFVEEHVRQMEMTLNHFQFNAKQIMTTISYDTIYCLRQCIRQYELLKMIWVKILPPTVYSKTIGYLLNAFCKKLIDVVLSVESIPSKSAEKLASIYKYILSKGPKLFQEVHDVRLYVENWQKLKGLVFILGAGLVDINDYWSEGKGPLTLYFTVLEMKGLISALFGKTKCKLKFMPSPSIIEKLRRQ